MGDPPRPGWRVQEGPAGEAVQDVQGAGHQLLLAVRLQGCLRWRPEHRVRYDLRQPRGCQEVRAQVPPHAVWYGQGQDHGPQAAQRGRTVPRRCVVSRRPRRWALRRQLLVDSSRRWDINENIICVRFYATANWASVIYSESKTKTDAIK